MSTAGGPGPGPGRSRESGALVRSALGVLRSAPLAFLAVGAAFVVPVELAVSGIGLERLSGPHDRSDRLPELLLPALATLVVTAPLVTVACAHLLEDLSSGRRPAPGEAILRALESFRVLFIAVVIATAGVALGLLLLIVPGVYVYVRWLFVPQAVALEGKRDVGALRRSSEVVEDAWWRAFATLLLAYLVANLAGLVIGLPLTAVAVSADSDVPALAASVLAETIALPFVAVVATLLFRDLKARRAAFYG